MRSSKIRTSAAAIGAAAMLVIVGISGASAAPPSPWLPDADLVCGSTIVTADQWVHNPKSSVLFITAGEMAGHYVLQDVTAHGLPGLIQAVDVPADYASYPVVLQWERGKKSGHESGTCLVVSRFAPMDFTVIGPVTLAKVSG